MAGLKNQKEEIKISVIIPVYNTEQYLEQCADSVREQTYQNIEIILVDDGSPDRCPVLCEELAAEDDRIRVIHKKNGGLSDARNSGIKLASGDYVMFLDSDDFWDDMEALERLVWRIQKTKADVLNFSCQKYYEVTGRREPYFHVQEAMPEGFRTKKQQFDWLMKNHLYVASAWNKMIRRELLDASMEFCTGVYSEDIDWCARLMQKADSMDFVCEDFYCYRQRNSSISHMVTEKRFADLCSNIQKCISIAEGSEADRKPYLMQYAAYQYGTFFAVQAETDTPPEEYMEEMKACRKILSYHGGDRKIRLLNLSCRILGFQGTCTLLRIIYGRHKNE